MRRCQALLPVLAVLCAATPLAAQTIAVRSGEHPGFTRLVLDIGAQRDWRLEGEGDSRRLVLEPAVDGFATDQVFQLIPRSRLSEVQGGDRLELRLACDCPVEASRYQARYLVIDIRDPVAPPPDPMGDARAAERLAAAESLPDMARLLAGRADAPLPRPTAPAPADATPPSPATGAAVDLGTAAQIMAEQLARAAASGLLDAAVGRPLTDADPVRDDPGARGAPDPVDAHAHPPDLPLRAETALDAARHATLAAAPRQHRLTCLDPPPPIAAWSASEEFHQGLGQLRLALFDARDVLQQEAAIALARHYLHFGFGAEAAFWLDQVEAPPEELRIIAGLVDAAPGPHFPPDPDPLICSEEELLWRYLDGAMDRDTLTDEQTGTLQRVTAALPPALRDQIAPRVARRLLADGATHAARNLRDLLHRAGTLPQTALLRLDLDLGLTPGGPEATRSALALAMRDDGADPVMAMAQAMAFDRRLGLPGAPGRLEAAEALLREVGLTPGTAPLWHETVLARAAEQDIPRLIDLLAQDGLPEAARMPTLTALFADRVEARDTPSLYILARLFGPEWTAEGSEAGRARVAAMAELRAANLSSAADALRAGQRLLILPARPATPPTAEEGLRTVWQSGDWRRLAAAALPPHADIASRLAEAPDPPDDARLDADGETGFALAALAAQVADSRTLRAEVAALLASPAPRPAEIAE